MKELDAKIERLNKIIVELCECDLPLPQGIQLSILSLNRELKYYDSVTNSKKTTLTNLNNNEKISVQIGGGKHYLKNFINIDIVEPADIIADVRESIPMPNESTDFIFSEHFLEHIDFPYSANKFLSECYRILKPEGQIAIGVPNSEMVIKMYVEKQKNLFSELINTLYEKRTIKAEITTYIDLLNLHFRDQIDVKDYTPHFWAYDYENLSAILLKNKFNNPKPWNINFDICNPKRIKYSIYVTATK